MTYSDIARTLLKYNSDL